jgi:hypothetical protein
VTALPPSRAALFLNYRSWQPIHKGTQQSTEQQMKTATTTTVSTALYSTLIHFHRHAKLNQKMEMTENDGS